MSDLRKLHEIIVQLNEAARENPDLEPIRKAVYETLHDPRRYGGSGNSSDGVWELRRTDHHGPALTLEVCVGQYHRDPSPGREYPRARAVVTLGKLEIAALHYLTGRWLHEHLDGPGEKGAQHFIDWASKIHMPLDEKLGKHAENEAA